MRLGVLLAVLSLAVPASAAAAEGDIIVVRAPGSDAGAIRAEAGVKLVKPLAFDDAELVAPRDGDVAEALHELRADDDVVAAEVDSIVRIASAANDIAFPSLWGLQNILMADAWEVSEGAGVAVGVIDTGAQSDHEDLEGQVIGGYDFFSRDPIAEDGNGHGTHVAGTIAALANNGKGIVGVAPQAKVVPLRALGNDGEGYMSDIAAAFDYAGQRGLRIVNASLTGPYSQVLEKVIASYPHTLYVVAAGNEAKDNDTPWGGSFPCALPQPNIVCVAANDSLDNIAWFSNYGAKSVDITAPGMGIRSTIPDSRYWSMTGTSMAAPHVAGVAAVALAAKPAATTSQLKWALLSSADAAPAFAGKSTTGGRLNATAAVTAITGELPAPVPVSVPVTIVVPIATATPVAPVTAPPPEPVAAPVTPVTAPPVVSAPAPVVSTPVAPTPVAPATVPKRLSHAKVVAAKSKFRVTFKLTQPAIVRFTVTAKGKSFGTWTRPARRGGNQFTLTRKLPNGKTLKPGRYTVSVALSATVRVSVAIRVR